MQLRCLCKYAYDCDVWVVLLPALVYIVAARCLHTYVAALLITVRPKYLIHLGQWINEAHWIYLQATQARACQSSEIILDPTTHRAQTDIQASAAAAAAATTAAAAAAAEAAGAEPSNNNGLHS